MRYAAVVKSAGLLMALGVALLVGCKKEKDQKGPSLTVAGDPGVVTGDLTLPLGTHSLHFKLIAQKGSGKDDADLKSYSFSFNSGAGNIPVFTDRPAPNAQSFTIDTTFSVDARSPAVYTYTFTVTDKNGKSASKSFKITFQDTTSGGPTVYVDSLMGATYSNNSDGKGSYLLYDFPSSQPLQVATRSGAESSPGTILFVYYYSSTSNNYPSLIAPEILSDNTCYGNSNLYWPNYSGNVTTTFSEVSSSVNFEAAGYNEIVSAFNPNAVINDYSQQPCENTNSGKRAKIDSRNLVAFKQVRGVREIYGLVKVVNRSGNTVTLSVKVARPQ